MSDMCRRFLIVSSVFLACFVSHADMETSGSCVSHKKNFLEKLVRADVDDALAFGLPPDEPHTVIKAIPTKNLSEWMELRFSDGELNQIRKVSPLKTIVMSWDNACKETQTVITRERKDNEGAFSDADLKRMLAEKKNGVLYTISPNHPLSEMALPGVMEMASKYNLPVTILVDPTVSEQDFAALKDKYKTLQKMESVELIYRGMFNHFPSTIVYKNEKILGRPMLGARAKEEYDLAFKTLLEKGYEKTPMADLLNVSEQPKFGALTKQSTFSVVRKFTLPASMHVKFVRVIPNSEQILIFEAKAKKMVHLFDTKTEKVLRTWSDMTSPYISADGKFVVMMDMKGHLVFQELSKDQPFFSDTMPAWYPGVSVLKDVDGKSSYRVITRMMDLKVQDYQIDFSVSPPMVTRLGVEHQVCTNFPINATPYISRLDGDKFTLIQPDNSRQMVKLLPDNTCEPIMNLGFWTWKAAFNFDDTKIGFTAVRVNSLVAGTIKTFNEMFVGHSFIYDRMKEQLTEMTDGIVHSFSFPEFRSDGTILILTEDGGVIYKAGA